MSMVVHGIKWPKVSCSELSSAEQYFLLSAEPEINNWGIFNWLQSLKTAHIGFAQLGFQCFLGRRQRHSRAEYMQLQRAAQVLQ